MSDSQWCSPGGLANDAVKMVTCRRVVRSDGQEGLAKSDSQEGLAKSNDQEGLAKSEGWQRATTRRGWQRVTARRCVGHGCLLYDAAFRQSFKAVNFRRINQSLYSTTFLAYGEGRMKTCTEFRNV